MKTTPFFALLLLCTSLRLCAEAPEPNTREIWVCVEAAADSVTRAAQTELLASGAPLLRALAATHPVGAVSAKEDLVATPKNEVWVRQAVQNLIFLGTPDEGPTSARLKGFTFGIDTGHHELWRLGIGRLQGDVGYVETSFNPYLYSDQFEDHPYSTLLVRIGGTTPKGVALAANAFVAGMNHGVVAGPGTRRAETTLLDLDPSVAPPPMLPAELPGGLHWAGWTQCPAQEYRALLDYEAPAQPTHVWRVKYLAPGVLNTASPSAWLYGPGPISWGNAVTLYQFAAPEQATRAYEGLLSQTRNATRCKVGDADAFSVPFPQDEALNIQGRTQYWVHDAYLVSSSLSDEANALLFP